MSWLPQIPDLEIPPFVSVGGGSEGPGFLGMTWAPFVVNSNGDVRDLHMQMEQNRLADRMGMLAAIESNFIGEIGGDRWGVAVVFVGFIQHRALDGRRRACQDSGQDGEADDQQADGSLQDRQRAAGQPATSTATPASAAVA